MASVSASIAPPVGRFAPSPTGRMHLGNLLTALVSWLSVKSRGGRWVLRIEDLDTQRSRKEYAQLIEEDLMWLGLEWDEGGTTNNGPSGPYCQSERGDIYARYLAKLDSAGLTYGCSCRRADILATQAPHQSDGRVIYGGRCRPEAMPRTLTPYTTVAGVATRLWVPDRAIEFTDRVFGPQSVNLATECGDFIVRRGDGAWAYQLAVVVDDALMGITEVVRGHDLLLSAAQQIYLYEILQLPMPEFFHVPLVCNNNGVRLSKRDSSLGMEELRRNYSPAQLLGQLAHLAGLIDSPRHTSTTELTEIFNVALIPSQSTVIV